MEETISYLLGGLWLEIFENDSKIQFLAYQLFYLLLANLFLFFPNLVHIRYFGSLRAKA